MKRGKALVDQVTKDSLLVQGYDESLSPPEIFEQIEKYFPNIGKAKEDSRIFLGEHKGHKYAIRCKNITYLGNPHPHYKKRIQIADDLYDFYHLALTLKAKPILLGIYSFCSNTVFVDFKIDTYIKKKAHNSSAHVYVSDLLAATSDGFFQKIDYFGNTVTAIRPDAVEIFLDDFFEINDDLTEHFNSVSEEKQNLTIKNSYDKETEDKIENSFQEIKEQDVSTHYGEVMSYAQKFKEVIVPKMKDFFYGEESEWKGIECYKKMINANYRNKYQAEWVGFYLEYEFEKFILEKNLQSLIVYRQDKTNNGIDLDLYFPIIESYGDLKAHSEESRGIQGNDWDTIWGIINEQDEKSHIYYIVCEHSTEKDSLYDYEVTKFWNKTQGKENLLSYSTRMKNRVQLKKVYFLDINYSNREYLSLFRQGVNSNGKPRAPKIMIEQDNLQYFIVEQIDL